MNPFKEQRKQDIENWRGNPDKKVVKVLKQSPISHLKKEKVRQWLRESFPEHKDFIDSVCKGQQALLKVKKQKSRRKIYS